MAQPLNDGDLSESDQIRPSLQLGLLDVHLNTTKSYEFRGDLAKSGDHQALNLNSQTEVDLPTRSVELTVKKAEIDLGEDFKSRFIKVDDLLNSYRARCEAKIIHKESLALAAQVKTENSELECATQQNGQELAKYQMLLQQKETLALQVVDDQQKVIMDSQKNISTLNEKTKHIVKKKEQVVRKTVQLELARLEVIDHHNFQQEQMLEAKYFLMGHFNWEFEGTSLDLPPELFKDLNFQYEGLSWIKRHPRSKSRYQYHSFIGVPGNGPCGFHQPCGAATTSDGFLYLVDSGNNRIKVYKLDPEDGRARYIYVGEYGGHKSHLDNPCGIIIDEARRNIIVLNRGEYAITIFDSYFTLLKKFGTQGKEQGEFNLPTTVALSRDRDLVVTDTGNHRIQIISQNGDFITKFGSRGMGQGQFRDPYGLVIDVENKIVVSDKLNKRLQIFDACGKFLRKIDGFESPTGMTLDAQRNIIVADVGYQKAYMVSNEGTQPTCTINGLFLKFLFF